MRSFSLANRVRVPDTKICIHVHAYTSVHMHVHVCVCVYLYTCVYIHVHVYVYIHVHLVIHIQQRYSGTCARARDRCIAGAVLDKSKHVYEMRLTKDKAKSKKDQGNSQNSLCEGPRLTQVHVLKFEFFPPPRLCEVQYKVVAARDRSSKCQVVAV